MPNTIVFEKLTHVYMKLKYFGAIFSPGIFIIFAEYKQNIIMSTKYVHKNAHVHVQ